jgi:hypothetical protein
LVSSTSRSTVPTIRIFACFTSYLKYLVILNQNHVTTARAFQSVGLGGMHRVPSVVADRAFHGPFLPKARRGLVLPSSPTGKLPPLVLIVAHDTIPKI